MLLKKIKKLAIAIVLFLMPVIVVANVSADDYEGLDSVMTISPPKQKVVLIPGEDYEGSISVSCMGAAANDLKYSVTIGSFGLGKDESGNVDYNDTDIDTITSYNQIMNWIELKKKEGTVARGATDTIPFVIHVPENAPAGGQYATIIVQDDTVPEESAKNSVSIVSKVRFASSIFAEVAGETEEKGEIRENNVPSFLLNNQLTATSWVKNNGNVHTNAKYTLQVWPLFSDEEVCTNEEETETSMIMPETERFHAQSCGLPSIGIYRAIQKVTIFGETSMVERTIIFCPLSILFAMLFAIIVLVAWIVYRVRANKKRVAASSNK